ncbi:MAG: GNAT family N-acetyltransferase [Cellvibrionales bacterium]
MTADCDHKNLHIRAAIRGDRERLRAMMPQLADFDIPVSRQPEHLWQGDAALMDNVLRGDSSDSFVDVITDSNRGIVGMAMVTMRKELLSEHPSAHLEALIIDPALRGRGIGSALMQHVETTARSRGAQSLTLHVFNNNHTARKLYQSRGFESELIRAIKWL